MATEKATRGPAGGQGAQLEPAPGAAQGSAAVQVKRSLAGQTHADQSAMLAPPGPFAVQMAPGAGAMAGASAVHEAADRGTSGGGGALPHGEAIQRSFGHHDVSAVQAHSGSTASAACADMGAQAFAYGDQIAFAGAPDLHTAAHEAAHVVQQRGGVQLKGGVGQEGDVYERHADAVADKVVSGASAEGLLDQMSGGRGGGPGSIQMLRKKDKTTFEAWVTDHASALKGSLLLGEGRSDEQQESNYRDVQHYLGDAGVPDDKGHIADGAAIIAKVTGRPCEVKEPPKDGGAARQLLAARGDMTDVCVVREGVEAYLDIDQLKHQHPDHIIGTRHKGGGNRFTADYCSEDWHVAHTIAYMADWAEGLDGMAEGQKTFHGQAKPVDEIHYEGYCLLAAGKKYVVFHCYPANGSDRLM